MKILRGGATDIQGATFIPESRVYRGSLSYIDFGTALHEIRVSATVGDPLLT